MPLDGSRPLDASRIEVVEKEMVRVLRGKSGPERLRIAHGMWSLTRDRLTAYIRYRHPDWEDERIAREVARRLGGGCGGSI